MFWFLMSDEEIQAEKDPTFSHFQTFLYQLKKKEKKKKYTLKKDE